MRLLIFVGGDNALAFILAAIGTGVMGKLGFTASRAGSHCRGVSFFVGASFVPL
jgi:hypothetical protein